MTFSSLFSTFLAVVLTTTKNDLDFAGKWVLLLTYSFSLLPCQAAKNNHTQLPKKSFRKQVSKLGCIVVLVPRCRCYSPPFYPKNVVSQKKKRSKKGAATNLFSFQVHTFFPFRKKGFGVVTQEIKAQKKPFRERVGKGGVSQISVFGGAFLN